MKKITFLVLSMVLPLLLAGQPILNQAMNFSVGDTYRIDGYYDVAFIDVGSAGPDKAWDFSEIDGDMFIEGEPALVVNPSATPFADSAAVQISDIAIKLLNSAEGPYLFYKNHGDKRELIAQGYYATGSSSFGPWDPPMTDLMYPLAMGNSFGFNYEYNGYDCQAHYLAMRDSGDVHVHADAWGSIITPLGEFSNVLRLKSVITSHWWIRFDAGEPLLYLGEFVEIQYNWYDPLIKAPLMSITEMSFKSNSNSFTGAFPGQPGNPIALASSGPWSKSTMDSFFMVQYLAAYGGQTSVNSVVPVLDVGIYPNPARGTIKLNLPSGHIASNARIFDLTGRQLISCTVEDEIIDITDLSPGMYIIQVTTVDGLKAESKMIVK